MNEEIAAPTPILTGPDTPGMRRLRDAVASGKHIYPAPTGERSVVFLVEMNDIRASTRRIYFRNPTLTVFMALLILLLPVTSVADALHRFQQHHITHLEAAHYQYLAFQAFAPILAVAAMFAFFSVIFPLIFKRQLDQVGPITASMSPEGVYLKNRMAESRVYWRFIKHIERTKTHLLLVQNLFGGIIIPLWAFPDRDAADAFYEEAKQHQAAAKTN